jgi:F-type H+-transporting ATPase subunit a
MFSLFGLDLSFAPEMLFVTWIVMGVLVLLGYLGGRNLSEVPGGLQNFWEVIISFLDELVQSTLGRNGRRYTPLISTIFLFVLFSNLLAIIPRLEEPTKFLSTDLALGIMVFIVVHFSAVRSLGFKGYLKHYCDPVFLFAPLHIVGEMAKLVSHSFRLFGNILGGSIIMVILGYLSKNLFLPIILQLFFVLLAGSIQALVFTVLAVTYISLWRKEEGH